MLDHLISDPMIKKTQKLANSIVILIIVDLAVVNYSSYD
uniref:Uncharacterized protein n=1 Tax=Tetranychus urticae TaxID=32264 RepID=T1L3U2_TETUR